MEVEWPAVSEPLARQRTCCAETSAALHSTAVAASSASVEVRMRVIIFFSTP
jgi:hypothetical protein